jgi:transposase
MATRHRKAWRPDRNGRYSRQLGWIVDRRSGLRGQPKFYLGTDPKEAARRNSKLEEFWERIESLAIEGIIDPSWMPDGLCLKELDHLFESHRPIWNDVTLSFAKQMAKGVLPIVVPRDGKISTNYAQYIHQLREHFPMIPFAPEDQAEYQMGYERNRANALSEIKAHELCHAVMGNLAPGEVRQCDHSLHQALDAYCEHAKQDVKPTVDGQGKRLKPTASNRIKNAKVLKERHKDVPLSALTFSECERMLLYWRNRPPVKGKTTPIAVCTAQNMIYEVKRFLRWLHRSEFAWKKPEGLEDINTRVDQSDEEVQATATKEKKSVFDLDELCILNEYCTPLERVLFLLGLNCGFGAAESGTLRINEIHLFQPHPDARHMGFESSSADSFIFRVRLKNRVYGQHLLWPQTVDAIRWAMDRRSGLGDVSPESLLLVSNRGLPLFRATRGGNSGQRIKNIWGHGLLKRVCRDYPEFRRLSFGKLRKTASSLVRRFGGGGPTAGVFLCHGHPVKSDRLLDIFAERNFARVFRAIRQVEEYLRPVFEAAPKDLRAQPQPRQAGRGTAKRLAEMKEEGYSVREIAEKVGMSKSAVARRLEK